MATLDGAASALDHLGTSWDRARLAPARASAAEGYLAAVVEGERLRARRAWEYPACAVSVADGAVAIVAGLGSDEDAENVADWAARVAVAVSRDGYKLAIVTGAGPAKTELLEALGALGVATAERLESSPPWHVRLSSIFRRS